MSAMCFVYLILVILLYYKTHKYVRMHLCICTCLCMCTCLYMCLCVHTYVQSIILNISLLPILSTVETSQVNVGEFNWDSRIVFR